MSWTLLILTASLSAFTAGAFSPSVNRSPVKPHPVSFMSTRMEGVRAPFSRLSTNLQSSYSPEEENEEDDELWTGNVTKVEVEISSDSDEVIEKDASAASATPAKKGGILNDLKSYIAPPDDGLTFRQRLAKLGLAAALSYGWVSNMSYSVSVSLAWYIFSKRTGMSPIAPGQWKGFLTIYAGFFVFNNIIRPLRVAVAVAISPKFDRTISRIQKYLKVSKPVAVTVTVVMANVVGTLLAMSAGISLASILAGVPVWAK